MTISHLSAYTCSTNLPGSKAARPLAPENLHSKDSSLKAWRACCRFGDSPSKTQAFLCFHRIQAPRIQRELNPFLCCFCTFFQDLLHQSAKETLLLLGVRWVRFKDCRTPNQNWRANTQDVRMCWIFSSFWSQRGQRSGWGRPLFCSLSAVQQRFRIANQTKENSRN